ncbi:MAG: 3-keto-5-aminohexanoate cleavage protein [Roseobacter sp.]
MSSAPCITVAPNGARRQKTDHPALPISPQDLAETARDCFAEGAWTIHLHVRDQDGAHSLDAGLYKTAIAAVHRAAPHMDIQITTEAADRYSVEDQLHLLETLKPAAASIAVREIARAPKLIAQVYDTAHRHGTQVQHILYGTECIAQLELWLASGLVPTTMRDAILVLGQYAPARAGKSSELAPLLKQTAACNFSISVCAFGPDEQACLTEAAALGCDLRVGFENNLHAPEGNVWENNAQAVSSLRTRLKTQSERHAHAD